MKNQESPVFDNGRGVFNPAAEIFTEVDRGSPMSGEFQAMESGTKHTLGTFDEERDGGGDETIDPITGKPYKNVEVSEIDGLRVMGPNVFDDIDPDTKNDAAAQWLRANDPNSKL